MTRRRREFRRGEPTRQRKRLVLIATEGARTEPIYFQAIKARLGRSSDTVVHVFPGGDGSSAPEAVLRRLRRAAKNHRVTADDRCWAVVDRDSWELTKLNSIATECSRAGYGLALSNPCFELWLVLHLPRERTPLRAQDCTAELLKQLGTFTKSGYDASMLLESVEVAIARADRLDDQSHVIPDAPSTRVHELVRSVLYPGAV